MPVPYDRAVEPRATSADAPDMSRTRRRRPALLTALALLLAIESVTTIAVRAAEITDARADLAVAASSAPAAVRPPDHDVRRASDAVAPAPILERPDQRVLPAHRVPVAPGASAPAKPRAIRTQAKPQAQASAKPKPKPQRQPPARAVRAGRNHVWSPALGIDRTVHAFPCSRSQKPGNVVYRWGCAGRNNVYLMGHAANVFGALNRAYYNGRLRPGLKVYYADSRGTVRTYSVRWWKVVRPTPDAAWAWASQSRPSMTLQTCIGKNSEYRLMVRLAQVG